MRVLVLGGSGFVGRAVAEVALARGDQVDVVNRGVGGPQVEGVTHLRADRTDASALAAAVGDRTWDAVIDTWSGAPIHATTAAAMLGDRAGHYGYVSSRSVYARPVQPGQDETAPVVDADPADTDHTDYARAKRGAELGVLAARPDALLARAGLIVGPHEDVGRLPWWLDRAARSGRMLAPGPPDRPLQLIDARDLATWMLDAAGAGVGGGGVAGAFNAVSRVGHTTMGELLEAVVDVTAPHAASPVAELVWFTPDEIAAAGVAPWTELPIWVPPDGPYAFLHDGDTEAAHRAGLRCRPIADTVRDTWAWMRANRDDGAPRGHQRAALGLDPEREAELLQDRPRSGVPAN